MIDPSIAPKLDAQKHQNCWSPHGPIPKPLRRFAALHPPPTRVRRRPAAARRSEDPTCEIKRVDLRKGKRAEKCCFDDGFMGFYGDFTMFLWTWNGILIGLDAVYWSFSGIWFYDRWGLKQQPMWIVVEFTLALNCYISLWLLDGPFSSMGSPLKHRNCS